METIRAYRERVGALRKVFTDLLAKELELYEARSTSWQLQIAGGENREADLAAIKDKIDLYEIEVEFLHDRFVEHGTGGTWGGAAG